jgi:hypothetical protein
MPGQIFIRMVIRGFTRDDDKSYTISPILIELK